MLFGRHSKTRQGPRPSRLPLALKLSVSPHTPISFIAALLVAQRAASMATRIHTNSPLPAPAMHATHGLQQSKSHVLAGVQDAYWSDDEAVRATEEACAFELLANMCTYA